LPHVPQLAWLPVKSTHALPHFVKPGAHALPHLPSEHTCAEVQAAPHAPQLAASELSSRHSLPHSELPVAQAKPPVPPVLLAPDDPPPLDGAPPLDDAPPALAPAAEVPDSNGAPAAPTLLAPAVAEPLADPCGLAPPAHATTIIVAPRTIGTLLNKRGQLRMVFRSKNFEGLLI
jgi:hypothetical protein